jgi:signal recognition particle GTPase
MVVGVNGVGKTTTIGKLAHKLKQAGNQVVLALPIPSALRRLIS